MFGGLLNSQALATHPPTDLLLLAYSSTIYHFSLATSQLLHQSSFDSHILHFLIHSNGQQLSVLTQNQLINCQLQSQDSLKVQGRKDLGKGVLAVEGRVSLGQEPDSITVRFVDQKAMLYSFEANLKALQPHKKSTPSKGSQSSSKHQLLSNSYFSKILYHSNEYLIVQHKETQTVTIFPHKRQPIDCKHSSPILSATTHHENLILGDSKGKIYIFHQFLQTGSSKIVQKLEWHTHPVRCLQAIGQYLYSAGEEGVVVLWHLRENSKDFLPRIGGALEGLIVDEGKVFCFLKDNSMKCIDLQQDKAILTYKTLVNPSVSGSKGKEVIMRSTVKGEFIYISGEGGSLQKLDLHCGQNIQVKIISRNIVSSLDNDQPSPHRITGITQSQNQSVLLVAVEGARRKQLRFMEKEADHYRLLSKVDNPHLGGASIKVLSLENGKFLTYSKSDSQIKVWGEMSRRKQSVLERVEKYFGCEGVISHRGRLPQSVDCWQGELLVTYAGELVIVSIKSRDSKNWSISAKDEAYESVWKIGEDKKGVKSLLVQTAQHLLLVSMSVDKKQEILSRSVIHIFEANSKSRELQFNSKRNQFVLLLDGEECCSAIHYAFGTKLKTLIRIDTHPINILSSSWANNSFIVLDSTASLTNLLNPSSKIIEKIGNHYNAEKQTYSQGMVSEEETAVNQAVEDYYGLARRFIERSQRKEEGRMQSAMENVMAAHSLQFGLKCLTESFFI